MLTVGSLFAGIGGFDLGLERAGMRSVWQSELDPYCQRVLARHWPDVLRVPDVRDVGPGTVPPVDVICGGFPCQDLSYAGKGAGLAGARSGLWVEYARIVRELRPRYVIVENVAALLARGLGVVLGDLAACGYDAEWDCIPASAVGASHRRDRIWIVAYPARHLSARTTATETERQRAGQGGQLCVQDSDAHGRRLEVRSQRNGRSVEPRLGASQRRDVDGFRSPVADADGTHGRRQRGWLSSASEGESGRDLHQWSVEPDVGRVAHGVPARVDRLRALGNALVPQVAEWIGRRIVDYEEGGLRDAA